MALTRDQLPIRRYELWPFSVVCRTARMRFDIDMAGILPFSLFFDGNLYRRIVIILREYMLL